MKVLKEGNPNGWKIERDCTGEGYNVDRCCAKLLVEEEDICVEVKHGGEWCYFFECPCCKAKTQIPMILIPESICKKARVKYYEQENRSRKSSG